MGLPLRVRLEGGAVHGDGRGHRRGPPARRHEPRRGGRLRLLHRAAPHAPRQRRHLRARPRGVRRAGHHRPDRGQRLLHLQRHDDERGAQQARPCRRAAAAALPGAVMPADATTNRIAGLEALLKGRQGKGPAPVETWNPPYCGDIGMKIRADGVWFYAGTPIGRMPLVKLFAGVLRKDEDGRHYLVTPAEKVDVDVADAPFLAVEMEVRGRGREHTLVFRTNVDDIVEAGPAHPLRFEIEPGSQGLKPYLRVRGRLEALLTRALYYDLVELAVDQGNGLGVCGGGTWFGMPATGP